MIIVAIVVVMPVKPAMMVTTIPAMVAVRFVRWNPALFARKELPIAANPKRFPAVMEESMTMKLVMMEIEMLTMVVQEIVLKSPAGLVAVN